MSGIVRHPEPIVEHEAHVALVITGFGDDPNRVTAVAGFEPTEAWTKGQPMRKTPDVCHTHSGWSFKSPLALSASLEDHLEAVVSALEPHAERVHELASRFKTGIFCALYLYTTNPGFHISEALTRRIAALGLALDFDLYCLPDACRSRNVEPGTQPNGGE